MRGRVIPWVLVFGIAIFVGISSHQQWFRSIDNVLYDFIVSRSFNDVSGDIVIVEIDDESLSVLGGWPWSRSIHADLLSRLSSAEVVVFDIVFPDPQSGILSGLDKVANDTSNYKENSPDRIFADAIARHGSVVLPVYISEGYELSAPVESMPTPLLSQSAKRIGHVQIPFEQDGIVRSIYLYAGVAKAYWQQLALAAHALTQSGSNNFVDNRTNLAKDEKLNPFKVINSEHRYIRFVGPPDTVARVTYSDIIADRLPEEIWQGKKVLVGATAMGLGDYIPTPAGYMPGVELHANILHALEQNSFIEKASTQNSTLASVLAFLVAAIFLVRLSPRSFLLSIVSLIAIALSLAFSALVFFSQWLLVLPFCAGLVLLYPLWSWRRIEIALGFLQLELDELNQARAASQKVFNFEAIAKHLDALSDAGIVSDWRTATISGKVKHQWPAYSFSRHEVWSEFRTVYDADDRPQELYFKTVLSESRAKSLIRQMIDEASLKKVPASDSFELVEQTIRNIKSAQSEVAQIQQRMNNSMELLQDAVLLTDLSGRILFKNLAADSLFTDLKINDSVISVGQYFSGKSWSAICFRLLVEDQEIYQELTLSSPPSSSTSSLQGKKYQGGVKQTILLCQGGRLQVDKHEREDDSSNHFLFVFTDVSQLRSAEQSRREMLAFLSHDMRSPIVSQLATITRAREAEGVDKTNSKLLNALEAFGLKSLNYAESFLQLIRAENIDKKEFYLVDLHGVVDGAVAEQQGLAQQKSIRIEVERSYDDAWVDGDVDLLTRAVSNLIGNAIQHSQTSSGIVVRLETSPDLLIGIKDFGVGMNADAIESLFEPHFRARNRRANVLLNNAEEANTLGQGREQYGVNSYGMGLSFVHTVVNRHGGRIVVDSDLGIGTEFKLYFNKVDPE